MPFTNVFSSEAQSPAVPQRISYGQIQLPELKAKSTGNSILDWHRLRIRCIIVRREQEDTFAFGDLVS